MSRSDVGEYVQLRKGLKSEHANSGFICTLALRSGERAHEVETQRVSMCHLATEGLRLLP